MSNAISSSGTESDMSDLDMSPVKPNIYDKILCTCEIEIPDTKFGEQVYIIGTFNNWDPSSAIPLKTNKESFPLWTGQLYLIPWYHEYKYIVKDKRGNIVKWYPMEYENNLVFDIGNGFCPTRKNSKNKPDELEFIDFGNNSTPVTCVGCNIWLENTCMQCEKRPLCTECISSCASCKKAILCNDCIILCTECKKKLCTGCARMCTLCGISGIICAECTRYCYRCEQSICNGCIGILCEDCGVYLCDFCYYLTDRPWCECISQRD